MPRFRQATDSSTLRSRSIRHIRCRPIAANSAHSKTSLSNFPCPDGESCSKCFMFPHVLCSRWPQRGWTCKWLNCVQRLGHLIYSIGEGYSYILQLWNGEPMVQHVTGTSELQSHRWVEEVSILEKIPGLEVSYVPLISPQHCWRTQTKRYWEPLLESLTGDLLAFLSCFKIQGHAIWVSRMNQRK